MPSEHVLEKKKVIVNELVEKLSSAKAIVIADYRGLTVEQDTEMRRAMRNAGVEYKVVKNTLTRFAVNEIGFEGLDPYLVGPTSIAYSDTDPVAPAKVMNEYAGKFGKLEIKAGVVEGEIVDIDEIKAIANLPSREVLIARVLEGLNSPIAGFVNVLNANIKGLVVALNAIAEKKESA
jgi:large subunit ribosomal protein L10